MRDDGFQTFVLFGMRYPDAAQYVYHVVVTMISLSEQPFYQQVKFHPWRSSVDVFFFVRFSIRYWDRYRSSTSANLTQTTDKNEFLNDASCAK